MVETIAQLEVEYNVSEGSIKFCIAQDLIDAIEKGGKISIMPSSIAFIVGMLRRYRDHVKNVLSGEMENYDTRAKTLKNEVTDLLT